MNILIKLVSIIDFHSSNSYSSGLFLILVPALLTRIFNFPKSLTALSISELHEFSSVTSTICDMHSIFKLLSNSTDFLFLSLFLPAITTLAPASPIAFAIARPIPPFPPVTRATLPLKSKSFII